MGYYVDYQGTICIPPALEEQTLQALKDLNKRHNLKTGGRSPATGDPYEDRWFSWMPSRYHETVTSCDEVLELLGFELGEPDDEGCRSVYYSNKVGAEEHFLHTIVECGGSVALDCNGEEWGDHWKWETINGQLYHREGRVVFD